MKRAALNLLLGWMLIARAASAADGAGVQSPLALGASARSLALGRTGVAFASGPDAVFWNAARLGLLENAGIALFHTDVYIDDAGYNAGFAAYPSLDVGTFALGFQRLNVSEIQRRDDRNQLLGTFGTSESSLMLGYGRRFGRTLALGAALQLVQQSVDTSSDASVGLDLGLAFERPIGQREAQRIGLGLELRNALTPRLKLQRSEVPDPRSVNLGAAYALAPSGSRFLWLLAADLDLPNRAEPRLGAGLEMTYRGVLALRAGVDHAAPTFGAGVAWRNVRFDYALVEQATLQRDDRFSVELRFGRSTTERRQARQQEREREVSTELARQLEQRETEELARARTEADAAYAASRFEEAQRLYRRVLALDPNDASALARADAAELEVALAAANQLLEQGATGEAAAALQAIVDRWSDKRAADALAEARKTLEQTADRGRQIHALLQQALAAFSQDDLVAADGALTELLRLDPNHEVAKELSNRVRTSRVTLGEQALTAARTAAARGDYDTSLDRLAQARKLLGARPELTRLATEWTTARSTLEGREDATSSPLEPRSGVQGEEKKTAPSAQRLRELDGRYRDGLEAFGRGDFQGAIRSWRSVWVEWPEYQLVGDYLIKAYLCEGVALYSNGKYDAAIELCRQVLEIDPSNAKATRYLQRMREERSEMQQIGGQNGRN